VLATIRFKPGTREKGIAMFGKIAEAVQREAKDVLSYIYFADAIDETLMWSFERFSSEDFKKQVHVKREDILRNMALQQDIRTANGLHHWYWTQIGEVQEDILPW
jgi:quinol monooxygenase YgiN